VILVAYLVIALTVLLRAGELVLANRNTRNLKARGGIETGAGQYRFMVLLHMAWLMAVLWLVPAPAVIHWGWLAAYLALQALKAWAIASLGPAWTLRIVTVPGATSIRRGPYRFVRHPGHMIAAGEILALPLAFGEILVAVVFSILNAAMLYRRIRLEEAALAGRPEPG
jgi:methyltransferase